jgi:cytochrome c551/c552
MKQWAGVWLCLLIAGQAAAASEVLPTRVMSDAEWRDLATKRKCVFCHERDSDGLGPSLKEIAEEYAGKAEAEEILLRKVYEGGVGKWGPTMMPSQAPPSNREEIQSLVRYILLQK